MRAGLARGLSVHTHTTQVRVQQQAATHTVGTLTHVAQAALTARHWMRGSVAVTWTTTWDAALGGDDYDAFRNGGCTAGWRQRSSPTVAVALHMRL